MTRKPTTNPRIGRQPMSFVRLFSKAYRDFRGGGHFKIRGVTYEILRDGSMRAHGKPRGRVKRLREERGMAA